MTLQAIWRDIFLYTRVQPLQQLPVISLLRVTQITQRRYAGHSKWQNIKVSLLVSWVGIRLYLRTLRFYNLYWNYWLNKNFHLNVLLLAHQNGK